LQFSTVTSKATGKALDAGGSNNSVYPHPSPNAGNEFQQWGFQKVGDYYMIINKATRKALDAGGSNSTLPYIHYDPNTQNPFHLWNLQQVGDAYMIVNKATGKALDSGGDNGNQIYMHPTPMPSNPFHLWKLSLPGGGGSNNGGSNNYLNSLSNWSDWQWEDVINSAVDINAINTNPNSEMGKLYRDLSNDVLGQYFPMSGAFISDDYYNATGGSYGYHGGIDIEAGFGTPVKSIVDGTVVVSDLNNWGWLTIKGNDGKYYIYAHLDSINYPVGTPIEKGTVVGTVGARGQNSRYALPTHLHFEVSRNPWGALASPVSITKLDFRNRSYNPLKTYWEIRRNG
jgi:hypothetical protein